MPNWCEGSLKLRGKYADILRFFEEGVNAYKYDDSKNMKNISGLSTKLIPKEEWCEIEEFDGETIISNKLESAGWIYIEETKRAFIEEDYCSYSIYRGKNDTDCIFALPFKQAWGIRQQDWIDIAKKYNLEIKIFGIESGAGFWCTFHVLKDGVIMENNFQQYQDYKDYVWNCPLPWMGG